MALRHVEGRHATPADLALVHDARYIERIREAAAAGGMALDADTVTSEGSWDAACAAAGCVLDAVDLAMSDDAVRSFCAVRPPGHHALRDRAMGFCLFGNAALGASYARRRHGVERVLIVDWDVHHGNGTQALVENDSAIHFVSMHQWPWYPGSGAAEERGPHKSLWNVPMPPGLPAQRYVDALNAAIDAATGGFPPHLVIISAGFDSLAGDPLGGFTLEPADVAALTRDLVARAEGFCAGRVVATLEGGYVPARVGAGTVAMLEAMQ